MAGTKSSNGNKGATSGGLYAKLAAARAAMRPPKMNMTGQIQNRRYRYADLAALLEAVVGPLHDNGLLLVQPIEPVEDGGGHVVTSRIMDPETEEVVEASACIPLIDDARKLGAWVTYMRRYTLAALVAIAAEEDTDAYDSAAGGERRAPAAGGGTPSGRGGRKAEAGNGTRGDGERVEELGPVLVEQVAEHKRGTRKDGSEYTMYRVRFAGGEERFTFSTAAADVLSTAAAKGDKVIATVTWRGRFSNITSVEVVEEGAGNVAPAPKGRDDDDLPF